MHLIHNCLRYVPWKDSKAVAIDLKPIYQAATLEEAEAALDAFSAKWDALYPAISQIWIRHWGNIISIFDQPNGYSQSHLHYQCYRIAQSLMAQSD